MSRKKGNNNNINNTGWFQHKNQKNRSAKNLYIGCQRDKTYTHIARYGYDRRKKQQQQIDERERMKENASISLSPLVSFALALANIYI